MDETPNSVENIWQKFHTQLREFIARRVDEPSDVDDILQEVFLRIHRKMQTLRDDERLNGWVYRIARNAIIDHHRKVKRTPIQDAVSVDELPDESTVAADEIRRELSSCLRPFVEQLPPPYRDALLATELDGATQAAAAAQAGISLSGMKSRVQRGREKLKQMLLACCHFEFDSRGTVMGYYERNECCLCCVGQHANGGARGCP